jgi:thiosulfate dehydrogenase [quinone] large subunit
MPSSSRAQATALVLLRTVIGWHFLYEGYYKLLVPGWSRAGAPLPAWTAAGYLKGATGPFAGVFHSLAHVGGPWIDLVVPVLLLAVGLSLVLGAATQTGAWVGIGLLTLFYLAAIPMTGVPVTGAEGTYLLVNKTLVEWAALLVVAAFRTGAMAGLDLLWARRSTAPLTTAPAQPALR